MLAQITELLNANLSRVENLVTVYRGLAGEGGGRRPVTDQDILRAAIVMLHASMEEFLRSLLIWRAPHGNKSQIDQYPLAGTDKQHADKFNLGSLVAHKGKTVDELIAASVSEYLEHYASFNHLGEVKDALKECGILEYAIIRHSFGDLPEMISRRHNIVHRADRNAAREGSGNHPAAPINVGMLNNYIAAVRSLRDFVGVQLAAV